MLGYVISAIVPFQVITLISESEQIDLVSRCQFAYNHQMKLILLILCLCLVPVSHADRATPFTIYLVRHAEKVLSTDKNPPLTKEGEQTAELFADQLQQKAISTIYSTDYTRTKMTAKPLAGRLKLKVTSYNPGELNALAERLLANRETVLVVGHSNTTPELIALLGGEAEPINESTFGDIYSLTFGQGSELPDTKIKSVKN